MKKLLSLTFWCLLASSMFGQNLTLQAPMLSGNPGDTLSFAIQATNFSDMISLQFSVNWDTTVVKYVSTDNYNPTLGINASLFGLAQKDDGRIGFSWDDVNIQGVTVPGTVTFFDLKLVITGSPGDTSLVQFGNVPTTIFGARFGQGTFPTITVDTVSGKATVLQQVNCANFVATASAQDPTCGQNNGVITVSTTGGTGALSYLWNDSNTTNPRTNLGPGTYSVTVTDAANCTATASTTLTNQGLPPVAAFNSTVTGFSVAFTDVSSDAPTSWLWDFGDGNTSTLQNPTHTYVNTGTYTVCLTVSNTCGTDSSCNAVTIAAAPANDLTVLTHRYTGMTGDTIIVPIRALSFTDMIAMQFSVNWDTTVVKYVNTQGYHPTLGLSAINFGTTQVGDGRLGFSWDDVLLSGVTLPDTLDMFDIRFCIKGLPGDSTEVDFGNVPTSMFASRFAGGTFPSVNVDSIPGRVVVLGNLCANFAASGSSSDPTCGLNNGDITTTVTGATGNINYNWFDGATSSTRTNLGPGSYTVIITDANFCTDTVSFFLVNQGLPPVAALNATPTGLSVAFTDASLNTPTAWSWDFGDGNTSNLQNPNHTYAAGGTYTACLTASNGCGADTTCDFITVVAPPANNITVLTHRYTGMTGDTIIVPIRALSFTDMIALQFSVNWDTTVVKFVNTQGYHPTLGLSAINFGTTQVGDGRLGFSWDDVLLTGVTLPDTLDMFDIRFCIQGLPGDSTEVDFGNVPTTMFASRFAGGTFPSVNVDSIPGRVVVLGNLCAGFTAASGKQDPTCGFNVGNITISTTGGTAPYSYLWTDGDTTNPRFNLAPGIYTVTVTDANGCTATVSDTLVNLGGLPPIANFGINVTGSTVDFTDFSSNTPTAWSWDFGDGNTSTLQNPTHTYANPGSYTACLIASNNCGSDTVCISVQVQCDPSWDPLFTGVSHNIIIPANANLTVNGQPIPTGYYLGVFFQDFSGQWMNGGFVVWNGTATSMTVSGDDTTTPNVKEGFAVGDTFVWRVYQPCGCEKEADAVTYTPTGGLVTHTSSFAVNGISQLASLSSNQMSATVTATEACFGNPVNGTATVTPVNGCAPYKILWDTPGNDSTFTVTGLTPGFVGFTVTDSCGCVYQDSVDIQLGPPPTVGIIASPSDTFCVGDTVMLNAIGGPFNTYQWSGPQGTPMVNSPQIKVVQQGLYTLFAIDSCGATATAFIFLVEKPLPTPTITASPDTIFCLGDSTILDATGNYTAYRWYEASSPTLLGTNPTLTVYNAGTYIVEVDSNGCTGRDTIVINQHPAPVVNITASPDTVFCPGTTVTLQATPGFLRYAWSTGDTSATIIADMPVKYLVTVTDLNGCMASASITLTQYPPTNVDIIAAPDSNFCPGDSVVLLSSPFNFVKYSWSNGDTLASTVVSSPGVYTLTVEDANGCIATDSITINQYPQPVVEIDGDTTFCYGGTVALSTIPSAFASYLWSTGASTPTILVDSTGTYRVQVTDTNGCIAEDSIFVLEYPKTVVQITSAHNFTICSGQTDTLDAGAGFLTYKWSTGDTTQSILVTGPGPFSVTVTDSNLCKASDTVSVTVNPLPQPTIVVSPSTGFCLEDTVSLTVPQSYVSYNWSNGASGPQIFVTNPAIYTVTVTDTNNCMAIATVDLTIAPVDTQEIFIRQGWSIISSYLCLDEKLMDSVFNPIDTAIWIVKDEAGQAYLPNMVNSIGDWDLRKGYRVKAYKDTVLQMVGQKVDHTQVGLNLPTGWSLISYLRDSVMAVAPALGTGIVSNLYLLKNQDGLAFIPSFSIDQVGNLAPGQGYWVKMISNDTLTYPARMGYYEDWYARPLPALHFNLPANTGENATLILPVEGMEHALKVGDEIGVVGKNGVLAGTGVFDGRNLAIALWGDDPTTEEMEGLLPGDAFDFIRWDTELQREVILQIEGDTELTYMPDAIMIVNFRKSESALSNGDHISYFPNPATSRIHFELDLQQAQQIELSLYDMTGRRVAVHAEQVAAGGHTFSIDLGQLARGAYTFAIKHQGGVKRGKLILE